MYAGTTDDTALSSGAPGPGRPLVFAGPLPARRFGALLAILALLLLSPRLIRLEADAPRGVSRDLSLSVDGSWYAATALDRVLGRENDVGTAYDRPLYTLSAEVLYRLFGASLATTHLISIPAGLLAIILTGLLARRLFGPEAGLLAALLLGLDHSFLVFNRSAVIYTFVAAAAALVLHLAVRGSLERNPIPAVLAWLVALAATFFLKEIALLLVLPLLLLWPATVLWARRDRWTWTALAAGAGLALAALFLTDLGSRLYQKLADYFLAGGGNVLGRALALEERSGLFAAAPGMVGLAMAGALCRRLGREERALAVFSVGGVLLFAPLSYSPLRYLLIFFPAFAVLSAGFLHHLVSATASPRVESRAVMSWWRALLLAYFGTQLLSAWTPSGWLVRLLLGTGAATLVVALWRHRRRLLATAPRGGAAAAVLLMLLCLLPQLWRTSGALAAPSYTVRHALREVESVLSPGAVMSGLHAHLLTLENGMGRRLVPAVRFGRGRLRAEYEKRGVTHLTLPVEETTPEILARFAADGADLEPVHTFPIRGATVALYRFSWAEESYELSAYEEGVAAVREGRLEEAAAFFEKSAAKHPRAAAPCSALAEVLIARGEVSGAVPWIGEALQRNPFDVRALALQAKALLAQGRPRDALPLLERIRELEPENRSVAELIERIRAW